MSREKLKIDAHRVTSKRKKCQPQIFDGRVKIIAEFVHRATNFGRFFSLAENAVMT